MSCPTCDATMTALGCKTSGGTFFICPRCGTAKTCDGTVCVPALVDFCRLFLPNLQGTYQDGLFMTRIKEVWNMVGIRESINTPDQRP